MFPFESQLSQHGAQDLSALLQAEGILLDPKEPTTYERLRADVVRIAADMDDETRNPPMYWTGIPFPRAVTNASCGPSLIISVGGTRTTYALMRMAEGVPYIFDRQGREVKEERLAAVKEDLSMPTPTPADTKDGFEMITNIVGGMADYLTAARDSAQRCEAVLLSWGFAQKVIRSGSDVLSGISARATRMQKDQAKFSRELDGKDLGALFAESIEQHFGIRQAVTVANDTIMALHYFLTPEVLQTRPQVGLFVNGTGSNFAIAESYSVRPEGVVSRSDEAYQPARLTRKRSLLSGESEQRYFVNYEAGSIPLEATRCVLDQDTEYPLEENALAGGKAFRRQFREIFTRWIDADLYERLCAEREAAPGGPEVSELVAQGPSAANVVFPGHRFDAATTEKIFVAAHATVQRSALHAALLLSAVSERIGFGLGHAGRGPDVLAMEGSVWRTPSYQRLVKEYWHDLLQPRGLRVRLTHEASYNASLLGPLYLAAAQRAQQRNDS